MTMTSKKRVLTTFAHQEPDRVPINYYANPGIDRRLKTHYGLDEDDHEGLRERLGVDFRSVGAPYVGPKLHEDVPGRSVDMWAFTAAGSSTRAAATGTIRTGRCRTRPWKRSRPGLCPRPTTLTTMS